MSADMIIAYVFIIVPFSIVITCGMISFIAWMSLEIAKMIFDPIDGVKRK